MSEKTAQSLMSQWATLLAETNRLIQAKDNRIRDLNDKLKEQENKWFLSEKSKCENVAELKRVRAILKNVEKKLVPETTLKNGKASEQPPLKRHLEVSSLILP
ncbi:hypothetical protein Ddc_16742 [Ditylenchus destructor]|nr:hypothetical protein Ddc_16742 [Ditylenchus destructor]